MRVHVSNLPGYEDFDGEVMRIFESGGIKLYLIRFDWEGEYEYVLAPPKYIKEQS